MDGCHGSAVSQGDVVVLLGDPSGDARVEPHELIGGVVAGAPRRPAGACRRQLDPVALVLHPLLQLGSTHVERLVSPSISEAG